jgi:hypothetical protein
VNEPGWEVYPEDESDYIVGDELGSSVAYLLGYEPWHDEGPEWLDRFREAIAERERPGA